MNHEDRSVFMSHLTFDLRTLRCEAVERRVVHSVDRIIFPFWLDFSEHFVLSVMLISGAVYLM